MYNKLKNNLDRAKRRKSVKQRAKKNAKKFLRDAAIIGDELRAAREYFKEDAE